MRKSILVAVLTTLIALTSTIGNAFAASSGPTTVIVSPGSRVCLPPISGSNKVYGVGNSNKGVRFTLNWSPDGQDYTNIGQSPDDKTSWIVSTNSSWSPSLFPGMFKLCARNLGTQGATVTLTLLTDADAP